MDESSRNKMGQISCGEKCKESRALHNRVYLLSIKFTSPSSSMPNETIKDVSKLQKCYLLSQSVSYSTPLQIIQDSTKLGQHHEQSHQTFCNAWQKKDFLRNFIKQQETNGCIEGSNRFERVSYLFKRRLGFTK
jgi:hypothetical protein